MRGAVAEKSQTARHLAGEDAEVLAGHDRVGLRIHPARTEYRDGGVLGDGYARGIVDGGGELVGVVHGRLGTVCGGHPDADLADPLLQQRPLDGVTGEGSSSRCWLRSGDTPTGRRAA
jgi:hypothetical protein